MAKVRYICTWKSA